MYKFKYMESGIKVTILIPFYKVEKYFRKTLKSVFLQTYQNIDYVFLDDGSPDNSFIILKKIILEYNIDSSRYIILAHKENEGIAKSRAECIANAKGDYVYFVDSDDWIEEDAIEQMVAATKNGSVDIVGCDFYKDFETGIIEYHHEEYALLCNENMVKCLNYNIATVLWKLLIRRSLFDFFPVSTINIGEDYIMSVKLFYYASSFISINKAFYHYVQYNDNRLSLQTLRSINDHILCINDVESFLRSKGCYDEKIEYQLLLRKFNLKSNFVLNKNLLNENAYNLTFPEAKGVWRKINYSSKERIKFWLAEHGLFLFLKLI